LNLKNDIDVHFPKNFWPQYNVELRNGIKVFKIKNAMFRSEAEKIKPVKIEVNGKKSYLMVKDNSRVSDDLKTRFHLKAAWSRTDGKGRGLLKRFEGMVPSHLVEKVGNQYKIALGLLPINSKYFKKRWLIGHYPIKFHLTVVREFGNYSTKIGTFTVKKINKRKMKVSKGKLKM
jgi:hypothetical protein